MTTIYLSSTYEDLKDYRSAVFDALRKAGYEVLAMEDDVATDRRPVEKCLADVAEADVYVGLFGFRYGYVPPTEHDNPDGLSITELELRHAEKLEKPCLTFVVSEDASWPRKFDDSRTDRENKGERINRLRDYLTTEETASFFSSPHELASLVQAALKQLEKSKKAKTREGKESEPSPAITWDIEKKGSPYPGLMHFTRDYARVFFGREGEVREILDRMCLPEGRFIIVSGGSGTGKSSLVDAGVLPKIEESGLPGVGNCFCVRMVPSGGAHPFDALVRKLDSQAEKAGFEALKLSEELFANPAVFPERIQTIVSEGMNDKGLVLFLDQMEELFTAQTKDYAKPFLSTLYSVSNEASFRVIATIRSDFLHHCHDHPELLKVLNGHGHYALGPVNHVMMHDMIVKPANCAGLKVSENLARRIVNESANLPVLAFVLNQLFEKKSNHELSEEVYNNLGGVSGAIAEHVKTAGEKIRKKLGGKGPELLPKIFQSLVIVYLEGPPTPRRPLLTEFTSELRPVVDLLIRERLLHTEGKGEKSTVSISHAELFKAWPALEASIIAGEKLLLDQTLLENRARKWEKMGKPRFSGLASGRECRDFRSADMKATPLSKEYLKTSHRAKLIRIISIVCIVVSLLLFAVIDAWMWFEGLTPKYAYSIAVARLNIRPVSEPEMEVIPGGIFQQGTDLAGPIRKVELKKFKIGKYEVTFKEYDRFVEELTGRKPSDNGWGREKRPVINVSWQEANDYARWLSRATGKKYRLPTESEWEYAARSRGNDNNWAGTSDKNRLTDYAVFRTAQAVFRTEPVGSRKPNDLGLHDMSGNVWEWVEDCWHRTYDGAPLDGRAWNEENDGECASRVIRGGSWDNRPEFLRASYRGRDFVDYRGNSIGFRLVQDID
jgi:formylglycine-generating enzyme required for sulfatase activity